MRTIKKILISLIFSCSFTMTIWYFIVSILNSTRPRWFEGDFTTLGSIMYWVLFILFLLSSISSLYWFKNLDSGFWWWKAPALLILPFSIPYLIFDYLDSKSNQEKNINQQINKIFLQIIVIGIGIFNILVAFLQIVFLFIPLIILSTKWWFFGLLFPFILIFSSIFLILNYYQPQKIFARLSLLGLTLNWFCLILNIVDKKTNSFFKPRKKNNKYLLN